jgi:hypothetical protein
MSSGMEECKTAAWARDKMFPFPERFSLSNRLRVAKSCARSCYSVGYSNSLERKKEKKFQVFKS